MTHDSDRDRSGLIDELVTIAADAPDARVPTRLETRGFAGLLRAYWQDVDIADLTDRDPELLVAMAADHARLAGQCTPGHPSIAVFVPTVVDHGWSSPHTAIQVVSDDMPYIVSSLLALCERRSLAVHLLVHPVLDVERDESGHLVAVVGEATEADTQGRESWVLLEIDRVTDPALLLELSDDVHDVLDDVIVTVADAAAMHDRALDLASELRATTTPPGLGEYADLLDWMGDGNFVFLGYREYDVVYSGDLHRDTSNADVVELVSRPASGLGILRQLDATTTRLGNSSDRGDAIARRAVSIDPFVNLTKTNAMSTVHRGARMDYVGVKGVDDGGVVRSERRFLGLWTPSAYTHSALDVPVLRAKVAAVLDRTEALPGSHQARQLVNILERYPRDELFQIGIDDLYDHAVGILGLSDRRLVRLFLRQDDYGRFWSALVFIPRDRFDTAVRLRVQSLLQETFRADRLTFTTQIDDSALARLHLTLFTPERDFAGVDVAVLERRIARLTRSWVDELQAALIERSGEDHGLACHRRWAATFPAAYREDVLPAAAVADIEQLEMLADDDLAVDLYRPVDALPGEMRLKVFRTGTPMHLSDVLPILRDHGVTVIDERPYRLRDTERAGWIYDFGLAFPPAARTDAPEFGGRFEDSFVAAWRGETESDGLNRLVTEAGLDHRAVMVARAYRRYLHQLGVRYGDAYFEATLVNHAPLMRLAVELFRSRFDPDAVDADREAEVNRRIDAELANVTRLDADRILQGFRNLIAATDRTSFYQTPDPRQTPPYIAFKIDPARLTDIPLPRPDREIYVYSPRVEGVHLRMGGVARGGIRWSERQEDYRTEVLGLMKAQNVKNAVIVPVGAKGGFVVKRPPDDPAARRDEVRACYQIFIEALLDVTDNLVAGTVVSPERCVRHDGDDTYLVVAADKGTATFSDTANEIAIRRGFWLGDAFASGGSVGYDHKAMGITARGAWESVTRHLRELGTDPRNTDFTCVGIGDMSGDVFGNGMLHTPHIRLIAAFDHRHVFVDPSPDAGVSFAERKRLFALPASSWSDYDHALISAGGGVFDRTVKSILVTPEIRAVLGLEASADSLTPLDLIRAILRAPVDLLWNGGIGTYVKARTESHDDVGDRANDNVRVDAHELRCRAVGEGGNLGFTQLGRVEYASAGGLINTDFIDNSGGVDCSDHEVNIKILLDGVVEAGDLTGKQRNELLASMTGEVAALVLADNAAQSLALAIARIQAPRMVDVHARQLAWLERAAGLRRDLEGLPTDDELNARLADGRGLTQPELAVLLAYTKNALTRALIDTSLPDDPAFEVDLIAYFPTVLRERHKAAILAHPLRRQLVATIAVNDLVNRSGMSMAVRIAEETSAPIDEIVRAFGAAWAILDLDRHRNDLFACEDDLPADAIIQATLDIKQLGERATRWVLRNRRSPLDCDGLIDELTPGVAEVRRLLPGLLAGRDLEEIESRRAQLATLDLPEPLPSEIALLTLLYTALDVVDVATATGRSIDDAAHVYFALDEHLALAELRQLVLALPRTDRWTALARSALRDDLLRAHAELAANVVRGGAEPHEALHAWLARHSAAVQTWRRVTTDVHTAVSVDLNHLSVALRELRNLIHIVGGNTGGASASPVSARAIPAAG